MTETHSIYYVAGAIVSVVYRGLRTRIRVRTLAGETVVSFHGNWR